MNSKVSQSISFLNKMMESIPNSVEKEFSAEVKKAYTAKKIKDIGKKLNVELKGKDKDILGIFEKFLYAFVKAYASSSGGQVGGGGNSPNQIVPYSPRRAVRSILADILRNPLFYAAAGTVVYQGILVYMGVNQINIMLSAPLAYSYSGNRNDQNQPMGSELVIRGEEGNQIAVIDVSNINIRPVTLYDVLINPRGAMADIATDLTLQLEQAKNNAVERARTRIAREFDARRQEFFARCTHDLGLTEDQEAAFRRLASLRNIMTGEQFGRAAEEAVRQFRWGIEDLETEMQRAGQNAFRAISRDVEKKTVSEIRNLQDAFGMVGEGILYFGAFFGAWMIRRCLRRGNRGKRDTPNGALENTNNGPEFEYLNNNNGNQGGGKRTLRKRKHKKNKKSRKKYRGRKKTSRRRKRSKKLTRKYKYTRK